MDAPLARGTWLLPACLVLALVTLGCSRGGDDGGAAASTTAAVAASPSSTGPEGRGSAGCAGELTGPATRRYRDAPGTASELVSLDLYRRPGATGCPVIVWVHGGGWRRGDKQGRGIDTKVDYAGRLGAALVSVNYRLSSPSNSVRWPAFGEDVAAAVAWVIDRAPELGIDPDRVVLMGHSAGAHLVSVVGTDPGLLDGAGSERSHLRCVVALDSAAYDLAAEERSPGLRRLVASAFGDDPATLAAASPLVQVRDHPDGVPDFLVVTRGSSSRVAIARDFADAVAATGSAGRVVDAAGYSHADVNARLGVPGEQLVTPPTTDFLRACLG